MANAGASAWAYAATYGGGLVGGDSVSMRVEVGAGASALVATQASTKVYRSDRGACALSVAIAATYRPRT